MTNKVALVILDGWGISDENEHNAVHRAKTPNYDKLLDAYPHTAINASEQHVGLPGGQMGNSEVGHMTIGGGRVFFQDLERITQYIKETGFEAHPVLAKHLNELKASGKACHLLGLVSPGGIHSHMDHLTALIDLLARHEIPTYLHLMTDGRDTGPNSAIYYVQEIQSALPTSVNIATIGGRYYGMDRDKRWDRIAKAYDAIVLAQGPKTTNPVTYIQESYDHGVTDEFIVPAIVEGYKGMAEGDGLICFNFRADRMRQIASVLVDKNFHEMPIARKPKLAFCVGMTSYSENLDKFMDVLFKKEVPENTLGQVVSKEELPQLRLAETEKYAHVTYFFNGGRQDPYPQEKRLLIESPKVATYDLQPEMSAYTVTDEFVKAIKSNDYSLMVVNYANPDMVGHTGNFDAACQALEAVDTCLGRVYEACQENGVTLIITADHGNVEKMTDPVTATPHTAHTTNLVPFMVIGKATQSLRLKPTGALSDIAPTVLQLMGLPIPAEMTGQSLIETGHF